MKGVKYVLLRLLAALVAYGFIPFGGLATFSALADYPATAPSNIPAGYTHANNSWYRTPTQYGPTCGHLSCPSGFQITSSSIAPYPGCDYSCVSNIGYINPYVYTCPYGGTLSGSTCTNVPACPTGQTRDSNGQCQDPAECNGVTGNAWIPVGTDNNGDGKLSDDEYTIPTYETVVGSSGGNVQGLPYNHGNCRGYFSTPTQTTQCKKSSANNKFYCYVLGTTKGVAVQAEEATQGSTGCTAPKVYFAVGNQAFCQDPVTELNPSIPQNDPSCSSLNQATYNGKTICLKQTQKPNLEKTNTESKQRVINTDGSVTETTTKRYENGSETVETKRWSTSNNGQVSGDPDTVETTTKEGPNGEKSPDEKQGSLDFDDPYGSSNGGDFPTETRVLTYSSSTQLFATASCPADRSLSLSSAGISIPIPMQPICYHANTYIRPIVLLFASFQALMIFVGGLKE